ncbi:MAG: insulinase family protein [Pseudomonadota bacterium]
MPKILMRLTTILAGSAMFSTVAVAEGVVTYSERPPFAHEISDIPSDPRIIYGTLDNGLRFAIMPNDTPEGIMSMRLRIGVGSLDEHVDERGIAHYLEHMAFNGSENVPEGELIPRLARSGLSFGADTNAHTSFDETVYKLNLPNIEDETIDEAFFLMREVADKLTLDADAIDRERGIIQSEKRTRNTAGFKKLIATMNFITDGTELTERLPIGTDETIANINVDQMRRFYETHYRPEKSFLVVVGDIDPELILERIDESFSSWEQLPELSRFASMAPKIMAPGRFALYVDEESLTDVTLGVTRPFHKKPYTELERKKALLNSLGNQILSFRLSQIVNEPDSKILRGQAYSGPYQGVAEVSGIQIGSQPEDWRHAIAVGEQELRRALEFGFSQAELDTEIESYANALCNRAARAATASTHGRFGGLTDTITRSYGAERVVVHPADTLKWFEKIESEISLAAVEAAFRENWQGADDLSVFVSTNKPIDNSEQKIQRVLENSRKVAVAAPAKKERTDFDFGLPEQAGTVVSKTHDKELDIYRVRFENNVLLTFKKTDFKDNEVSVMARVGEGALSLPRKDEGLRRLALNLLSSGGIGDYRAIDLNKHLQSRSIYSRAFFAVDSDAIEMSGFTEPDRLGELLGVLAAKIHTPGLQKEAEARYKRKIKAWYDTHDATPRGVASKVVPRIIRSGDRRFGFDDMDNFLQAPYEEAASWVKYQLANGMIEIAIVGDVDPDPVIKQVASTFGALNERLQSRRDFPAMTSIKFPAERAKRHSFVHSGEPDQVLLQMFWPAPDGFDDRTERQTRVVRAVLQNRLVEKIREESAATYSPGVGYHADTKSKNFGYMIVSLEVLPDAVEPIKEKIETVIEDLGAGNISQDEFKRAIEPIREDLQSTVQTNGYWMSVLADAQSEGRGIRRHKSADSHYNEMALKDVVDQAKRIFSNAKPVVVTIEHASLQDKETQNAAD